MRDPRLAAATAPSASSSSSSRRRVHQDVLEPSAPSPRSYHHSPAPHAHMPPPPHFHPSQPLPHFHQQPSPSSSTPYFAPQPASFASSARPDIRYVATQNGQHYYYDYSRGQAYMAVEEQPPAPTPPPPVHRVYVLRCASCDTFLSDRGMRAVLLLKPHIVLFSTDALPQNVQTYFAPESEEEEHVERTCECLTSSLNCHGCGRTVGYHIVSPCVKCNASVQKHARTANHHRYVFHHNEVTYRERKYHPAEKGVLNPLVPRATSPSSSRGSSPAPTPAAVDTDKDLSDPRARAAAMRAARRSPGPGEPRGRKLLKAGDTVYWHHLVPGGERTAPIDPREREPLFAERCGR
ncbi:hypothetical protein JCM10207_002793 [Rhodosporidiobolus poonsookiae]